MSAQQQTETRGFQAEAVQVLHLMVNSLYSNKEIFLRELVSNGSDAVDKLRFEALTDDSLYAGDGDLKITIELDKDTRTLCVRDNGIGMSREEVVDNLGTIARSGTREFIKSMTGDEAEIRGSSGNSALAFTPRSLLPTRSP